MVMGGDIPPLFNAGHMVDWVSRETSPSNSSASIGTIRMPGAYGTGGSRLATMCGCPHRWTPSCGRSFVSSAVPQTGRPESAPDRCRAARTLLLLSTGLNTQSRNFSKE